MKKISRKDAKESLGELCVLARVSAISVGGELCIEVQGCSNQRQNPLGLEIGVSLFDLQPRDLGDARRNDEYAVQ